MVFKLHCDPNARSFRIWCTVTDVFSAYQKLGIQQFEQLYKIGNLLVLWHVIVMYTKLVPIWILVSAGRGPIRMRRGECIMDTLSYLHEHLVTLVLHHDALVLWFPSVLYGLLDIIKEDTSLVHTQFILSVFKASSRTSRV